MEVAKIVQVIEEAEEEERQQRTRVAELERQREADWQREAARRQGAVARGEELLDTARARVGAADFDGALQALEEAHTVSEKCQRGVSAFVGSGLQCLSTFSRLGY